MVINAYINRRLRSDERGLPLRERVKLWHWDRVAHNTTPIFWCLAFIWWTPGFRWLWQLRCRNVDWRIERHNRRVVAKTPDLYDWSGHMCL